MQLFSEKQRNSFKDSNAKINIWEGAVRSGKTHISLLRFIRELAEGPEGDYCMISRTYDSFKRNILSLMTTMLGTDAHYLAGKREMTLWDKKIFIVGADDARSESKIRGATFSGAYVDEATIIPEQVFKMLISRCAMGHAKIFATTNPDSPYHWLKKDYLEGNDDVKSWQFTLEDNPKLTREEKDFLRRQYKGIWYRRFILGQWAQAEGAIYDFFDPRIHVIESHPQANYYIVGIDYGTSAPCAFTLIGINRREYPNMWVEGLYYYDSKKHQRQKTDSEYAQDLAKFIDGKHIKSIYIDPSAASFKLELIKSGIRTLYDAQNDVLDGIRYVSDLINNGTLKIYNVCKPLIEEMQGYVWDDKAAKNGVDKPLKQNDHALDSMRYALYTHFYGKPERAFSPEEIDREYFSAMYGGIR